MNAAQLTAVSLVKASSKAALSAKGLDAIIPTSKAALAVQARIPKRLDPGSCDGTEREQQAGEVVIGRPHTQQGAATLLTKAKDGKGLPLFAGQAGISFLSSRAYVQEQSSLSSAHG